MKMLAMRRESDQMFGSTSNAISNNTINASNDGVADGCCNNNNNNYHDGMYLKWNHLKFDKFDFIKCFIL